MVTEPSVIVQHLELEAKESRVEGHLQLLQFKAGLYDLRANLKPTTKVLTTLRKLKERKMQTQRCLNIHK